MNFTGHLTPNHQQQQPRPAQTELLTHTSMEAQELEAAGSGARSENTPPQEEVQQDPP